MQQQAEKPIDENFGHLCNHARQAAIMLQEEKKQPHLMNAIELEKELFKLLNEQHGGDFERRLQEISMERTKRQTVNCFYTLNNACVQLLIETIQKLKERIEMQEKVLGTDKYFQ